MKTQDFQELVEQSKLKPLPKQFTDSGNVLVAEGFFTRHPEYESPHWKVLWAIERGEEVHIGKPLYIEPHGTANGVYRKWTRQERINAAVGDALQFMKDEGKSQVYFA
jgi:hypothetical protein